MPFHLPELPYDKAALEPHVSARTLEFHYEKHHQTYLLNLNNLTANTPFEHMELEDIICQTVNDESNAALFNNAAQVWNHTFFWHSMRRNGGGELPPGLEPVITRVFGGLELFKEQFKLAGTQQFGSGWVWLVDDKGTLKIIKTPNAMTPIAMGMKPLATCDVWEHAYYLDYQNRRPDFLQTFLDSLINWDFVLENMA